MFGDRSARRSLAMAMVQARAMPAQDGHLMPQGDELELQCGTAAHPEREQGTEGGQKREHADDGMTAVPTICPLGLLSFEQGPATDSHTEKFTAIIRDGR